MKLIIITTTFLLLSYQVVIACTGGTSNGTINPTSTFSTAAISTGRYFVVNVSCGYTYTFTFCNNGGSAGFDTQITLNQTNNTTQIAYNDDNCGLQSEVVWTADFTGTIHVLISSYNCVHDGSNSGTLAFAATPPTVNYSPSCTTASATYPSTCPGTFAFNPAPGDLATIDPVTGFISDATPGASYTVDYTHAGGTITVPVTMGNIPCYVLNGDATYINVSGTNCIELTPAANSQTGCAWSESQIDFNSDFSLTLDYYFGNNPGGADGSTFTFQPNPGACGAVGAQLGAGGISNALIVEFDTYDNDGGSGDDETCDHIAVEIDGDLPDDPINFPANNPPYCGPVCAIAGGTSIENGGTHEVQITWNATTEELEVFFDGNMRLSCSGDFVNTVFGGQNIVYWGATAATGGLNNQQYFCPESVILLPTELGTFTSVCEDDEVFVYWTSHSEFDLDYYKLEYTYDGFVYYPYHTIHSMGNTSELREYTVDVSDLSSRDKYFRLTLVDNNGEIKNTDLIMVKDCSEQSEEIEAYTIEGDILKIESKDNSEFEYYLVDVNGKIIQSGNSHHGMVSESVLFTSGVYFVKAVFKSTNTTKTKKIIAF